VAVETASSLFEVLEDRALPLADAATRIPEADLARAWAKGLIEFGRLRSIVTGRPGPRSEASGFVMIVEDQVEWSGPRRTAHKGYRDLAAEDGDRAEYVAYRKYVPDTSPDPTSGKVEAGRMRLVDIKREEAEALTSLQVRLTDKGLAEYQTN
jgi:hypothetical protein